MFFFLGGGGEVGMRLAELDLSSRMVDVGGQRTLMRKQKGVKGGTKDASSTGIIDVWKG